VYSVMWQQLDHSIRAELVGFWYDTIIFVVNFFSSRHVTRGQVLYWLRDS